MSKYYSYKRISTDEDKQRFNRQDKALQKYADENKIKYFREFVDKKTGATFDRPDFIILDENLESGDTVVMKDLSRFTREAENGYYKYMEWYEKGVNIVFIDNPTISTDYVKEMQQKGESLDLVTKTALEAIIKLLIIIELDRAEKQREYISKAIKDGITASEKKGARKKGQLDKLTSELEEDIKRYLTDRRVTQKELLDKHPISRNTLKKYIKVVNEQCKDE